MKSHVASQDLARLPEVGFRETLRRELADRCMRNPQYSMRAFALDLDIDHSTLSQLLRGKRRITRETIERLGGRLGLSAQTVQSLLSREEAVAATGDADATVLSAQQLTEYTAKIVTQWHHFAILELTRVEGFRPDVRWIARVLDISTDEVTIALNRLIHLGMLVMEGGAWRDASPHTVVSQSDFMREAVAALQDRVESLARAADQRCSRVQDHSSTTIAISKNRIPAVIRRLHALRRTLIDEIESDDERHEVYRLDVHLFPITQPIKERNVSDGKSCDALADDRQRP